MNDVSDSVFSLSRLPGTVLVNLDTHEERHIPGGIDLLDETTSLAFRIRRRAIGVVSDRDANGNSVIFATLLLTVLPWLF